MKWVEKTILVCLLVGGAVFLAYLIWLGYIIWVMANGDVVVC